MLRLRRWVRDGWRGLRSRPSRLELVSVALGISLLLLVQAVRVRKHETQLAFREQLVHQEWLLVRQMAANVSRVERNLGEMQDLTRQLLTSLPRTEARAVEPPIIVLSPEERGEAPRTAEEPTIRR